MNLLELQEEVFKYTARPDLGPLTISAIQAATLKSHKIDFFLRDLYETILSISGSPFEIGVDIETNLPRFRAVKFARDWDNTTLAAGSYYTIIDPVNLIDSYNVKENFVAYLSGGELKFKSPSKAITHIQLSYYREPIITNPGYYSWVAEHHPFCIVYEATAVIFRGIGKMDEFRAYREMVAEEYMMLKQSNILAIGY